MTRVKQSIRFESETPSTPERVIDVARMFAEALKLCAEGGPVGEVTLTVANYAMVTTVNARDHQAAAAGERQEVVAIDEDTEVHGRIIGVRESNHSQRVRLRLEDDSSEDFAASEAVALKAARLYLQPVRARVRFRHTDRRRGDRIHSIEPFRPEENIVEGFARARQMLKERGIKLNPSDWLNDRGEH